MEEAKKTGYSVKQTTNIMRQKKVFSNDEMEGVSESDNGSLQEGYTAYSLAHAAYRFMQLFLWKWRK